MDQDPLNTENGSGNTVPIIKTHPYSFTPVPFQLDSYLCFMDIHEDETLLLGASNLNGKYWSGSIWCFKNLDFAPDKDKALTGLGCEYGVTCGTFLKDSNTVIIGEESGSISVYKLQELCPNTVHFVPQEAKYFHDQAVTSISTSNDSQKFVTSGNDLSIIVWENESLRVLHKFTPAHGREVTCVSVEKQQSNITFASTSLDGLCLLWDPRDSKPAFAIADDCLEPLTAVDWRNEFEIAVGSTIGKISLYDVRANALLKSDKISNRPIKKISFNRNGLLAVCSDSKDVVVWDSNQNSIIYKDNRHSGFVRDVVWHPVNENLYTCGFNKQIYSHSINHPLCTNILNDLKIS